METKIKKLQAMSYMLAILWAIMFVANVIQEVVYWNQYGELRNLVCAPFVVMLAICVSWMIISILHFRQANELAKLENPEAIYLQKNRIKSKLIAALVILALSLPVRAAIHGYMDDVVNNNGGGQAQSSQSTN